MATTHCCQTTNMEDQLEIADLDILSIIGFDGFAINSLHMHPDGIHMVYPFGNCVTIQNSKTRKQNFLTGHNNLVSSVALSQTGKYVASGQINHIGFKAMVIIWDFESRSQIGSYEMHRVRVESLAFSPDDEYLLSLGGQDDGRIMIFNISKMEPFAGAASNGANTGFAKTIVGTHRRATCFLTGGDKTLRLWQMDPVMRKLNFIELSSEDEVIYCGTTSGDIVKVSLGLSKNEGPITAPAVIGVFAKQVEKKKSTAHAEYYSGGVTAIVILKKNQLIVATGDGTVELVQEVDKLILKESHGRRVKEPTVPKLKRLRTFSVDSGVSSMKLFGNTLYIGTVESEIYSISIDNDMSTIFATCGIGSVRLWNTVTAQELLRIQVANMTCSGVVFQNNGKGIITSWNDGKIRTFTPQTGQLKYIIEKAHNKGVSALAVTKDDKVLVSGGGEGQVRVWDISQSTQTLRAVLKEHKGPVSDIFINHANDEAASASTDGSCIIWDILKCTRKNIIFANTVFMAITYHTSDCQVLTAGTDHKISYWETFDGSLIRDVEGSTVAINTIDVSPCGQFFVTGGNDQIVKLWRYEEGTVTHTGVGHAGIITQARFSPNGQFIVSVSYDGAIFRWANPHYKATKPIPEREAQYIETVRSRPDDEITTRRSDNESVKELSKVTKRKSIVGSGKSTQNSGRCICDVSENTPIVPKRNGLSPKDNSEFLYNENKTEEVPQDNSEGKHFETSSDLSKEQGDQEKAPNSPCDTEDS